MMTRSEAVTFLKTKPYKFGRLLGFTKLTILHNDWMKLMLTTKSDKTLQAHRGSYKTTCVSVVLALLIILLPNKRILFMRKTDSDVKEIMDDCYDNSLELLEDKVYPILVYVGLMD